jgi:hypothetical protein
MNDPPNPNQTDIVSRAEKYHYKPTLSPSEYQATLEIGEDISKLRTQNKYVVFVLGSFKSDDRKKLEQVIEVIDSSKGCKGVTMDEFGPSSSSEGLYALDKFRLLADYAHLIVGVCEHDQGGFLIEQGIISIIDGYADKSHILKRRYSKSRERNMYGWMQTKGVFEMFDFENHLHEWETSSELDRKTRDLIRSKGP